MMSTEKTNAPTLEAAGAPDMKKSRTTSTSADDASTPMDETTDAAANAPSFVTDPSFFTKLLAKPAQKFVEGEKVVYVVNRDTKIIDVWNIMLKYNILSLPVLQKTEHRYHGFIYIADIVKWLTDKFASEETRGSEHFWAQIQAVDVFEELKVDDLMKYPISIRNPYHPVQKGYSMMHVAELLAREPQLHRVPIVNKNRELINLITQSKIVKFVHSHVGELGSKSRKPLKQFANVIHQVVCIDEEKQAIEGFELLTKNHVSGIAVTDKEGRITGSLALRDMKCVSTYYGHIRQLWRFYMPLRNFLRHLSEEYEKKHSRPHKVVYCNETDTLEMALTKLVNNNVHRIFIVNDENNPIGIVSLKDILLELITVD
jgi:CBS domain-containing protein